MSNDAQSADQPRPHTEEQIRASTNLHVYSPGCPDIDRVLLFRDWLRKNADDRDLYARTKLALAAKEWKYVQNYADAKTFVIAEIVARAGAEIK